MKIQSNPILEDRKLGAAFSLIEQVVGMAVVGITMVALYSAIAQGFAIMQIARENLRATQILQEKTEDLRLYTLEQVTNQNWNGQGVYFLPRTFTERFYPIGQLASQGVTYTGAVTIATAPLAVNYTNDLMQVTFTLNWISGGVPRQRSVNTLVARNGIQSYIY